MLLVFAPAVISAGRAKGPSDADIKKADFIYLEASKAGNEQRFDDYVMLLRRANALNPDDPYIAADLAEIEMQISSDSALCEKGYRALRRRFDADPTETAYYTPYIRAAIQLNRIDDQIDAWSTLDRLMPDRNDPAYREAAALMQRYTKTVDTADFNRATAIYSRLEKSMGPSVDIASEFIRAYMLRSDTAAIEGVLQRLAKAAPLDVRSNLFVGSIYGAIGRPDSAVAYFDRAERADSTDGTVDLARAGLYRQLNDSLAYDAAVYRALSSQNLEIQPKFDLLVDYIRKQYADSATWPRIDSLFRTLEEVNPGEGRVHMLYGEFKDLQGRDDEAVEQFSYSIDLEPNDRDSWAGLMNSYIKIKDYGQLLGACRRGLGFFPGDPQMVMLGSMAMAVSDNYSGALNMLDSIGDMSRYKPDFASEIHRMRADYFEKLGMRDSSYEEYERAIALDAGNYMAMNNAAYFMALDSVKLDKAKLYASIAVESEPENPTFLDTYAWVMYRRGDFKAARELIDRAIASYSDTVVVDGDTLVAVTPVVPVDAVEPSAEDEAIEAVEAINATEGSDSEEPSAEVYDHAGDIYYMCGDTDGAVELWKKAGTLSPDDKNIKLKIKKRKIIQDKR